MQGIGGFLVLLGAGSFVLNFMGLEFRYLMWIDTWGEAVGIAIRIGLIVVGAALWLIGQSATGDEDPEDKKVEAPPPSGDGADGGAGGE